MPRAACLSSISGLGLGLGVGAVWALASGCSRDRGTAPVEQQTTTQSAIVPASSCGPHGLPDDKHFVAEGLCAQVVATDQGELRGLAFAPNGDLLGIRSDGELRRYRDVNHDGIFADGEPETTVWARTGAAPAGNCAFDGPHLYCGTGTGVKRWRYSAAADTGGPGEDIVVGAPTGGRHAKHTIGVWEGSLYVTSGSAANSMDPMPADYPVDRGVVRRFSLAKYVSGKPLEWRDGELFVRGVRNITALARSKRGDLLAVDQGLDDLRHAGLDIHDDNPAEPILRLEAGKTYGWPFCFYSERIVEKDTLIPPGTPLAAEVGKGPPVVRGLSPVTKSNKSDAWCAANATRPMSFVQAHSSVLSLVFVPPETKEALPARWRGGAFVALHGSWNRVPSTGNKVVFIPFDENGRVSMPTSTKTATQFPYEVVFGGGRKGEPKDGAWEWRVNNSGEDPVRPTSIAISPVDGAIWVSSDNTVHGDPTVRKQGAIYRIAAVGR